MSRVTVQRKVSQEISEITDAILHDGRILATERLGGMTNYTYAVTLESGKYVVRLPGAGTETLINRYHEKTSTELASTLDICEQILHFDAESGIKVTEYICGAVTLSAEMMRQADFIKEASALLHCLHTSGRDTGVPFDVFDMAIHYETFISENNGSFYDNYATVRAKVMEYKELIDSWKIPLTPCHNDPLCENWIRNSERLYLIDWEYAGMNDPLWDVADISIEADYDEALDHLLLEAYFGRQPTPQELFRFQVNKVFVDFLWSLWGKTRVPFDGEPMEQYALERYQRLEKNLALVKQA